MPLATVNGTRLFFEDSATSGPVVLFSHGLLWSGEMFRAQVAALGGRYRTVTYDHRGQGRSDESDLTCIDMDLLTRDAVALIEQLGLAPVHFVGLSMGGFVGMRLAARYPALVRSLTLMETSAGPEPKENRGKYRAMSWVARTLGVAPLADRVMPIMFGKSFLTDPARSDERREWRARLLGNRRSIWRAVAGVIDRPPVEAELSRITVPTLVMVGDEDVATPPDKAERIHAGIVGSKLVRVPRAGHTSSVENPEVVNRALGEFLSSLG